MEKWTINSDRPPRLEDGPFYAGDLGMFMQFYGWAGVPPKTNKQFDQAAKREPALRNELERLCQTFRPEHLSALAEALRASAKGAIKRGPRGGQIDASIVVTIKAMLHSGKKRGDVARAIASQMPGSSDAAKLKRARREIAPLVGRKPTPVLAHAMALRFWATRRAFQKLEAEGQYDGLTEEEARRLEGRVSEIMSRASAAGGE